MNEAWNVKRFNLHDRFDDLCLSVKVIANSMDIRFGSEDDPDAPNIEGLPMESARQLRDFLTYAIDDEKRIEEAQKFLDENGSDRIEDRMIEKDE